MTKTTEAYDQAVGNPSKESGWALTRRGRAALAVGGALLSATGLFFAEKASTDNVAPIHVDGTHKVVDAGDLNSGTGTVWDIAKAAEPGHDTGKVVNEIEGALKQEGLDPTVLTPGEDVPLPLDAQIGHVVEGSQAQPKE